MRRLHAIPVFGSRQPPSAVMREWNVVKTTTAHALPAAARSLQPGTPANYPNNAIR